jgi:hypothetical protein
MESFAALRQRNVSDPRHRRVARDELRGAIVRSVGGRFRDHRGAKLLLVGSFGAA